MADPETTEVADLPTRLRSQRKEQGMTLQETAQRAGLSIGFISQVERGLTTPSLTSLVKIARVLNLDLNTLFGSTGQDQSVTTSADRPRFTLQGSGIVYERLSPIQPGLNLNALIVHFPPGFSSADSAEHDGEEMFFVLSGELEIILNGSVRRMTMGDAAHYLSSQPHTIRTPPGRPATILWIGTMSLFGENPDSASMAPMDRLGVAVGAR